MSLIVGNDAQFHALMEKITRDRGFRCASYKDKCLRRRIAVRMRAKGAFTPNEYAAVLDHWPAEAKPPPPMPPTVMGFGDAGSTVVVGRQKASW